MANKHTATHQGFTFTRTSKGRVYTHAVLVQEDLAEDRKRADRNEVGNRIGQRLNMHALDRAGGSK